MKHAAQNARKMNDIGAAESAPWELELELLKISWSKACKKRGGEGLPLEWTRWEWPLVMTKQTGLTCHE